MGYFVEGLRQDIRSRVRTHKPKDKYLAMHLARDVEAELPALKEGDEDDTSRKGKGMGWVFKNGLGSKNWATNDKSQAQSQTLPYGSSSGSIRSEGQNRSHTTLHDFASQGSFLQGSTALTKELDSPTIGSKEHRRGSSEKNRGVHHLTYAELLDRKAKGFCFRCSEKFHSLHQCTDWQLRLVILDDHG